MAEFIGLKLSEKLSHNERFTEKLKSYDFFCFLVNSFKRLDRLSLFDLKNILSKFLFRVSD